MRKLFDLIEEYERFFMPGGIQQSIEELQKLIRIIGDKKFHTMAEIGVADGGTLWLYTQLFGTKPCVVTITDMDIRPIVNGIMDLLYKRTGAMFHIHECQNFKFQLKNPVQFLHIDGNHSYEGVTHDYYMNIDQVEKGGYAVIHDTMLMEGPIKFRQELEKTNIEMKTFGGHLVLCDCFAPNRKNPERKQFGMTVVFK